MELINGLKIDSYDSIANVIKVLRKYGNWSIADIKSRVENHEYILCFPCEDENGLEQIIKCYEELAENNISSSLFDTNHRPVTIQIMKNRLNMYHEIAEETQAMMDAEAEDDED